MMIIIIILESTKVNLTGEWKALYEGCSESNLQRAVNKTNKEKNVIIYKKCVHT
jgi:hypothetical protein